MDPRRQGFDVGGYAMTEKTRRTKFALSCFGAGSHKSADVGNPNSCQSLLGFMKHHRYGETAIKLTKQPADPPANP